MTDKNPLNNKPTKVKNEGTTIVRDGVKVPVRIVGDTHSIANFGRGVNQ